MRIASLDHTPQVPFAGACRLLTPQHVAEIDLTLSEADRLAAQKGKWRNRLRRALEGPLSFSLRPLDLAADVHLLALEEAQRRSRGYRALPRGFVTQWARQNANGTLMCRAKLGAHCEAYMLFLLHAPTATYQIGWTSDAGRAHSAHTALLWQASNWLAQQGYRRLDLGFVDTESAPGLARFKIGSGAQIRPLGPTVLHLPRPRLPMLRSERAA